MSRQVPKQQPSNIQLSFSTLHLQSETSYIHPIMADICSNPTCSEAGTRKCGRCKSAKYCSRSCQKTDWAVHKAACKAATQSNTPISNCYILRAAPHTPHAPVLAYNIANQIELPPLPPRQRARRKAPARTPPWLATIHRSRQILRRPRLRQVVLLHLRGCARL